MRPVAQQKGLVANMKKIFKRNAICFTLVIFFAISIALPAAASTISDKDLGYFEQKVIEYLCDNHPEIEYGTADYCTFLCDQLMENADIEMTQLDDYQDILLYASEYLYQLNNAHTIFRTLQVFSLPKKICEMTPNEVRAEAAKKEQEQNREYILGQALLPLEMRTSSFSASAAASYARTWALSSNPDYNVHLSDCANFASQAWVAGGINMTSPSSRPAGVYSTTSYWYNIMYYYPGAWAPSWDESSSFINIDDFYTYIWSHESITVTNTSSLTTLQNTAQIGDIVHLKNSNGNYYHTIIITAGTSGNLQYCGHTNNRYNRDVSTLSSESGFRIIHMN